MSRLSNKEDDWMIGPPIILQPANHPPGSGMIALPLPSTQLHFCTGIPEDDWVVDGPLSSSLQACQITRAPQSQSATVAEYRGARVPRSAKVRQGVPECRGARAPESAQECQRARMPECQREHWHLGIPESWRSGTLALWLAL